MRRFKKNVNKLPFNVHGIVMRAVDNATQLIKISFPKTEPFHEYDNANRT